MDFYCRRDTDLTVRHGLHNNSKSDFHCKSDFTLLHVFTYHEACKVGKVVAEAHNNVFVTGVKCLTPLSRPVATTTCKIIRNYPAATD